MVDHSIGVQRSLVQIFKPDRHFQTEIEFQLQQRAQERSMLHATTLGRGNGHIKLASSRIARFNIRENATVT